MKKPYGVHGADPGVLARILVFAAVCSVCALGQRTQPVRRLAGTVTFTSAGAAARDAAVTIPALKKSVLSDERGRFEFTGLPGGRFEVIVHLDRVPDAVKLVDLTHGDQILDFQLTIAPVRQQVTVTAAGSAEGTATSYHSVESVGNLELVQKNPLSLGEALGDQAGVANRSFGPAAGRPVIRGFDGDRVLVMQDGLRAGGIASGSGDEAEPIDLLSLDRVEVVKGPATLLYGSNAMGGVVNAVSANEVYRRGLGGYLTALGGTNSWQNGGSAGLQYGLRNFQFFASGGAQRAGDYRSPLGYVVNSFGRNQDIASGMGWYPRAGWLVFTYSQDRRRHGIPTEPDAVDFESLVERRHTWQARGGLRNRDGFLQGGDFALSYNRYTVKEYEFESDENVTELDSIAANRNLNYRVNVNHRRVRGFSGSFGSSGFTRDYFSTGAEAPAPRTHQRSYAAYALERIEFERIGFQFGGRTEQYGYRPQGNYRARDFVGFAGSAGMRVRLWQGGVLIANFQRSFRAPSLEELYNNGPHPGLVLYDIGNQNLASEHGNNVEVSLRHTAGRIRVEASGFYYRIGNFVFPATTGRTDARSGLPVVNYMQGGSHYRGMEARVEAHLLTDLWLNAKVDYVQATLLKTQQALPRIPPARGSIGADWRYRAFNVRPELRLAARQTRIYDFETPTAGYVSFAITGMYTVTRGRAAHVFALTGFNLGNALYRNHLSLLKGIAPEIGRGARLSYSVRF